MGIGAAVTAAGTAIASAAASLGTAGAVGLAGSAIGAGVSAYSAISSGEASQKQANYQAQVAKNNAQVANQNAATATQAGQQAASTQGAKGKAALGALTSGISADGVDVNSGSAAASRETQREEGQLDVMTTANNSALQAYGYRTQATNYVSQAGLDTAAGANSAAAGTISAGGDLLSGASSVGLNWAKLQQQTGNTGVGSGS